MGIAPLVVHWDDDGKKDLVLGLPFGDVAVYLNVTTNEDPEFGAGKLLQVGAAEAKVDIDVGFRATPVYVDWDNDGRRDLIVAGTDGYVHLFRNEGTDSAPDFVTDALLQENGGDLFVPTTCASPSIVDFDEDGRKDLITGNTEGQILFYANVGTDAAPEFSGYELIEVAGVPIDLEGPARSRPFVCDWTADGLSDLLVGANDGMVRLFRGGYHPLDLNHDSAVDLDDYELLFDCIYGPDVIPPDCDGAGDADADGDVDLADLRLLQLAFTG